MAYGSSRARAPAAELDVSPTTAENSAVAKRVGKDGSSPVNGVHHAPAARPSSWAEGSGAFTLGAQPLRQGSN